MIEKKTRNSIQNCSCREQKQSFPEKTAIGQSRMFFHFRYTFWIFQENWYGRGPIGKKAIMGPTLGWFRIIGEWNNQWRL